MASTRNMHLSTLSPQSKRALQSGNITMMLIQLNKLQVLYKQGTAYNKGALHRHVIAMKHELRQHMKQLTKLLSGIKDAMSNTRFTEPNDVCEYSCANNDLDTLSRKHMRFRKTVRSNTSKRVKAERALEEEIYKHYYMKLTKLTKLRESLNRPASTNGICLDSDVPKSDCHVTPEHKNSIYTDAMWNADAWKYTKFSFDWKVKDCQADCNTNQTHNVSYRDRFRNLLYKVMVAWKPRDFLQRMCGVEKVHSLCHSIKDHMSMCASPEIGTITNMESLDNLFRILRRFKISSPVFRLKSVYQGGGPQKCLNSDKPELGCVEKQDTIGKKQLSVKVVNSLSAILRGQYNMEYGLINVKKLYKASKIPGPVSKKLGQFNIQPVPSGFNVVQIHFCDNHYVTSEQRSNKIVVWDSLLTSDKFKMELYPQLRLTYDILGQYSDQPEGLITYETDNNNMQKDCTSCGIFAVMRAFFILSNVSSKIHTDVARSYLSSVLVKNEFTDYDLFSSHHKNVQMQVIIEKYMSNQKELQSQKTQRAMSDNTGTVSKDVTENTIRNRGRPRKRKYSQEERKAPHDSMEKVSYDVTSPSTSKRGRSDSITTLSHDVSATSVRKRGRPATLSLEEKKERIKESKLKHYHMTKGIRSNSTSNKKLTKHTSLSKQEHSAIPIKRGRPAIYSPEEKIHKDREKRLRHYHKSAKENTTEIVQKWRDKHKQDLKILRSNVRYKQRERARDKEWRENIRQSPGFRDQERQWIKDMRENPTFRERERERDREFHKDMGKNPAFRDKEKQRLKDMRENPAFRDREKVKDRESHKDIRENAAFRNSERKRDREKHKDMRGNPAFRDRERKKDRESHKDMRENPAFRDKERDLDRQSHKQKRSDPTRRGEENLKANKRKYGENEQDAIQKYVAAIQTGPSVVCTCCLQLWFPDNCFDLEKVTFSNPERMKECKTGTLYEGKEWLCSTCNRHLQEDRIPPISYANGMKFYDIPDELVLVQMEERCIALRQPFFQIRELPNGGQKSIKGNVVNVPMDVSKTISQLPRDLNQTETIGIKFQKKVSYKKCDYCENIRPQAVIKAAKYLIANSELYQAHNVRINETWQENIAASTDESIKTLMGFGLNDPTQTEKASCPDIIEIDLTMSDDDVKSLHSESKDFDGDICDCASNDSQSDKTEVPIKYENVTNSESMLNQGESSAYDEVTANLDFEVTNSPTDSRGNDDDDDDKFSEIDEMENFSGNMDTMLDSPVLLSGKSTSIAHEQRSNIIQNLDGAKISSGAASNDINDSDALVIAPGEGQHPISLFNDPDAEYLAFPSIYCGQRRPIDTECKTKKKPSKADIYKWECRANDRRVATCIPDLFFKYKSLQIDAVENVVGISMRKVKGKKQPTAGELKTQEGRDKLVNENHGCSMFSKMRNTPPYYSAKKKSLLAMVRQEGMPALFFTQSCADTRWPELLKVLGKLIDKKVYSDEEVENMSYTDRNRLVAADPVTVVRYFENKCNKFQQHIMNLKGSSRRFLRREFQNRGSPHSHEIHWITGAPVYDPENPENDKNVIEFIDTWISTKTEVSLDEEKYLKYQIHKHSNSCRKRGEAICRFGIPFFPMESTCILKPLESNEVDEETLEKLKNSYQELRKKLNDMGEGSDITHKEFLENIQMAEADYILTIRSSLNTAKVFYERKPNALRVNPYMKGMLSVIKANHDVQYPLNVYALVCYVADYLLKSQKGLSATLEQACRDAIEGDMKLKQQIRHIGYSLIGAIETSAPEAAYYIMQIPFTYCSVEVVFIPTSPPEERLYILKSEQELSDLPAESKDVLKSNKITAYARRPKELEYMCLADYVSELTVEYDKDDDRKECESVQSAYDCDEKDEDIIPEEYITYFSTEGIFPLTSGNATYKKRKTRRVIRFVNYNRLRDEENYCREKLLLYKPWRREDTLMGKHESYVKAFERNEIIIRHNMEKYEKFTEEVREAEELIENAENDEDFDEIAPSTEQGERDAELIGPTDSPEYRFFRPPKKGELEQSSTDILYEAGVSGFTDITIETMSRFLDEDKYLNIVRSLNEKQFQIYTHVMHHVSKGNPKPLHIFITGGAGVGKSMVLRCVYQGILRLISKKEGENPENIRIIVAAPTGKAAHLVQGSTIHSILKMLPSRKRVKYIALEQEQRKALRLKFKNLHTIIIDEISMVGTHMFRDINLRLQEIMDNKKLFGGLNVIIFGDLYQLNPVMDDWVFEPTGKPRNKKEKLQSADVLAPSVWMESFTCFELTQVMRQKDDQQFCDLLNRLREGSHTNHDIKTIKDNCELHPNDNLDKYVDIPHFFFTNVERNDHNRKVLLAKQGKYACVTAIDICTQTNLPEKDKMRILDNVSKLHKLHEMGNLERVLELKRGLPYDITINIDIEDGLCNGTSVVLKHWLYLDAQCPDVPSVLLVEPEEEGIGKRTRNKYQNLGLLPINTPMTWIPLLIVNSQFKYLQKHPITRQQFPITIAAAKTFNKAQGCSLSKAVMAFPGDRKRAHLHYVGLSRVTKMSGITILNGQFNADKIHVSELVKKEMQRLRSNATLKLCYTPLSEIAANFIVASFNAQSLHKHIDYVKSDWNMKAASILGVCETRIKEGEDLSRYKMDNFELYHIEQKILSKQRPYHGVALYVRKQFPSNQRFSMSTESFECIALDVYISPFELIQVVMCYKQPGTPNQVMFTELQRMMDSIDSTKPFVIMGDFNINKHVHSALIAKMSQVVRCKQIISDVTTKANTCIDLIFSNMNANAHGSIFTAVSHHQLTYAAFDNAL